MFSSSPTLRLLAAGSLIAACAGATGRSTTLARLPNTGINAIKVDAAGNIYLAGFQGVAGKSDTYDAFVAKLSPDGSKILYSTRFAGSSSDYAVALDIDSTGAAYIFGLTSSADFPVTSGAFQTTAPANSILGFVAKLDAQGKVVYTSRPISPTLLHRSPTRVWADAFSRRRRADTLRS